MKKYTIIYSDGRLIGSHYNAVTKYARVETDNLHQVMMEEYGGNVWMVFEGWPSLEGERREIEPFTSPNGWTNQPKDSKEKS